MLVEGHREIHLQATMAGLSSEEYPRLLLQLHHPAQDLGKSRLRFLMCLVI